MRVALVSETFLPKVDGIVHTLCHLLQHLAERGHDSILFAPQGGPDLFAHTKVVGRPGFPFPLYPELRLVPPHTDLNPQLARFRPDLVHVVNPVSLGLAGVRHARSHGVPLVASYHTDIPGFAARWGMGWAREALWSYLRWVHNQADLNLCPSQATLQTLDAQGFERLAVWGRGVDTARFSPKQRRLDWRARLTRGNVQAPLLLYVGRLSPEKRVDWLRPLLDALPDVRLAVVGDGPQRPQLERLFAGTPTVFTGYLAGDDLARAFAAADVFVFPGANETFGNVVLEAMASALPVVAPAAGGVLEHVQDGGTGLLFDAEEPAALLEAVARLVADPALAHRMGGTGRDRVRGRTWERVLDALLLQYTQLLEGDALDQAA